MQEEKFDTWLDLGPLYELQKFCREMSEWDKEHFSPLFCVFSYDTLTLLDLVNVKPPTISSAVVTPCLPAKILHYGLTHVITSCYMTPSTMNKMYNMSAESAKEALSIQIAHLMHNMGQELFHWVNPSMDVWGSKLSMYPSEISNFSCIVEDMMRVLEAYKILSEYKNVKSARYRSKLRLASFKKLYNNESATLSLPSLKARIILSLDLSVFIWDQNTYILTHKYLLEVINKVNEAYCALLYSHMVSGTGLNEHHYSWVVRFLCHISLTVEGFCMYSNNPEDLYNENKAFMYLKVMEGLGVACIILREDEKLGWYNNNLVNQLWQSVVDENLQPNCDFTSGTLYRLFDEFDISTISEVLGLVKLCGHPSIEIYRGLNKLKERTHANIQVNAAAVNRTIGVMKRELIVNFRRKTNKFPRVDLTHIEIPRGLRRMIDRNISPDSTEGLRIMSGITIEHWALVGIMKNEEFDPIDNQLVLLKDKALGMTRSKVYTLLLSDNDANHGAGLGPIEERRALLAFLLSDHFNISFRQYLDKYEHDAEWDHMVLNYLVIKLTAKELEEKPEGRMFGASPFEERNRRIVQEENTMRLMDSYFKDQLMTPDELQMLRKLFSFRHFNKMYPHHKLLQVSFDFSKWNNNMRAESIDKPASETIDKWYNTKIYGKTMKAYQSTLFYYKDMLRQDFWEGQLGGIEGLNQATWSVIFLCGIKQALEGLGVIYQLTVKGDDVRAALVIPDREYQAKGITKIRDSILTQLSLLCNDMGWQLNPHECFVSIAVIATSKQYQVNDTFLPAASKKIIKMESLSNLIFPTTEDMIASIFSTAHSACSQATTVLPAFTTALFIACRLLIREMWSTLTLSVEDVAVLAMWPQCLGGPGSLPLQTFFVRGENDMLSISVSLLRSIMLSESQKMQRQVQNILSQDIKSSGDLTLLVTDPYSISLLTPERPNAVLRRMMREHMPRWVKNPDLKALLTIDTQQIRQEFMDHITSMRPYTAKVVTTMWETSPFYIIEEVLSKFMESSTIFAFFARGKAGRISTRSAHRALSRVLDAARKRKLYWARIIDSCGFPKDEWLGVPCDMYLNRKICTTRIVHNIRKSSWGFDIKGITYPSLVDQNIYCTPWDLTSKNPLWASSDVVTSILIETERSRYQTCDKTHHYSAAPGLMPWLGAQTASKLELPTISTRITSPAINKIMRLINLKVNADILGEEFIRTVDKIIKSITGLNINQLRELVPEAGGGHISHRVAINSFSTNTMPNSRPNLAQIVKLASDSGAALRGDITNRTVNFAARHFYSIAIALWPLQSQLHLPPSYPTQLFTYFHNDIEKEPTYAICKWCCNDVDDGPIRFMNKTMPDLADFRYLSLVGCSEFEERTLRKNMAEALTGKIRRTAHHEVQNVNDPHLINVATHTLIRKLNKERMRIFEAAQGAQFACTPRAELLEILSVAMGIKSISSISLNIIRLLPSEHLYNAILSEVYNFCLNWMAVSIDPENLYQIDNIMDHLNPLSGLFDSLLSAQVLHKIQEGAITQGGIRDFKWTAGSRMSGGAAMKCFFVHHKEQIRRWITGEDVQVKVQIFMQREDDETIQQALEREYRRVVHAAINRANTTLVSFRISSHWRRIIRELNQSERLKIDIVGLFGEQYSDLKTSYSDQVCTFIVEHCIDDIIHSIGLMNIHEVSEFWAHSYMCIAVEKYMMQGEWIAGDLRFNDAESLIRLCDIKRFEDIEMDPISLEMLMESEFYIKWSSMMSGTELLYVHNIVMISMTTVPYDIINLCEALYNRFLRWLVLVNERNIMIMTQDNAEIILKKSDAMAERVLEEHNIYLYHPDNERYVFIMNQNAGLCSLGAEGVHNLLLTLTKPLLHHGSPNEEHRVSDNYVGLRYEDQPPPDQFFIDATEFLRGSGIHNTSVSKYLEIIDKLNMHQTLLDLGEDTCVVCLADGLGGVTARFLATYPQLIVIYNSMYYNTKTGKHASDAHESSPPIEVTSLPDHLMAESRLLWKGMYPGDLTREDVQHLIVNVVKTCNRMPSIITMDADIPWHDNLVTARKVWFGSLMVAAQVQHEATINIFKCFCVHHPVVYEFCHTVICLFSHVHLYRASYTRQRSTEFFLVFSEPRNLATLVEEVKMEEGGRWIFSRSLMIADYVMTHLDYIGNLYMRFRTLGENHVINLWHHLQTFVRSRAYPLDLTGSLMSLKITHPVMRTCLCMLLHDIQRSVSLSLNQANENLQDLHMQAKYKQMKQVGVSLSTGHAITSGWKGLQMSLRKYAKLQIIRDWISHHLYNRGEPNLYWGRGDIERAYTRLYTMLDPWKGYIAPVIVQNSLLVCCERFNDNWTIMMSSTVRKCQQMWGSILLCLAYVHNHDELANDITTYLSHNISVERCCFVQSRSLFLPNKDWSIPPLAVSLSAPHCDWLPHTNDIPDIDTLLKNKWLIRGSRTFAHVSTEVIDPNLLEQIHILPDQVDEELMEAADEYK